MTKHLILLGLILGICFGSRAQTKSSESGGELVSTPPALTQTATTTEIAPDAGTTTFQPSRKIQYGLSAGTQFSRLYGTATFLEPSILFPVTKRFSAYASLNMITTFGGGPNLFNPEMNSTTYTPFRNQHYILNAGGNYMVNERLNLTGSVWRDFSNNPMPTSLNMLTPGGTNGLLLRANYHVTKNLSISGGFRYSNGNGYNSMNSMWYNPGSPFEF